MEQFKRDLTEGNTMQPDLEQLTQVPSGQPLTPKKSSKRKQLLIMAAAGIVGLLLIVLLASMLGAKKHRYGALQPLTVGSMVGQKAVFSYPKEMAVVSNSGDSAVVADYATGKGNTKTVYAEIEVDSSSVGTLTSETIKAFKDIMKNKRSGYQQTIDSFSTQTAGEASNFQFGNFTDFRNDSVKEGLIADFSYTSKSSGKVGKGRLIFAFGGSRLYGMVLLAEQSVWEGNAAIWNNVTSSLKIDK